MKKNKLDYALSQLSIAKGAAKFILTEEATRPPGATNGNQKTTIEGINEAIDAIEYVNELRNLLLNPFPTSDLSKGQREAINLVARGFTVAEIETALGISNQAVRLRLQAAEKKTNVHYKDIPQLLMAFVYSTFAPDDESEENNND